MSPDEFGKHYHYLVFKDVCHERKGAAFQTFFENIMHKHDNSFISVKPSGRQGDWKCDGFSSASGTVYQCYAPEGLTAAKAVKKVHEDFSGALDHWKKEMVGWIFVWSAHDTLPPQVLQALENIRSGDHGVTVDDWSREHLWVIVKGLPHDVRIELLGHIPKVGVAPDMTAMEIKTLLTFLAARDFTTDSANFDLTDIAEKLQNNGLSASVRALVTPAVPIAKIVQSYLTRHPDPEYSSRAARALVEEYQRLAVSGLKDADEVFWKILQYVASNDLNDPKRFWAALGIVSHYFELCDIFER
jgi:hypothetical protein